MNIQEYKKKNPAEYCLVRQNGFSNKKIQEALQWNEDFSNVVVSIAKGALEYAKRMQKVKK